MSEFYYDFSIIVPTRNRPQQVAACLDSLAGLDFPRDRFEVVVVDDESAQPLDEVVSPFRERLHLVLLRQKQVGPAGARNRGGAEARGCYLAFTDDDCRADSAWLRRLHLCLTNHPDDLIGGKLASARDANIYSETFHLILDVAYQYYDPAQGRAHFFASSNLAMSSEKFRALGGFAQNWPLAAAEDRTFCLRWLQRGWSMTYAPDAIVRHHQALNLSSFWRLYFRYGRGAYHYHQARGNFSGAGGLSPAWRFYWLCFRRALAGGKLWRSAQIIFLLFVWQLANATGYFSERFVQDTE